MDGGTTWANFSSGCEVYTKASMTTGETMTVTFKGTPQLIYFTGITGGQRHNAIYANNNLSTLPVINAASRTNGTTQSVSVTCAQASALFEQNGDQLTLKNNGGIGLSDCMFYVC